ncbi:alpha/beta fold hydrolase [Streptomyces sp. NBC_00249]|uniref:thioesterase II family protein n=1 Tax=Streptomyces sp. NBC_00249 TaxID=2975690 RepID=UPI0022515DD5|nr:alpha/beta fold hydrolase [Streptomyces sp. NBC_00249]MCX5199592.1 alpha/beta fold hydrolase [Streptomyces sp. NBC_00249]
MASDWFRRFGPAPDSDTRLICFPHAGGAASAYLALSQELTPEFDVVSVQYPGRQDRRMEPAVDDIGRLVGALADELAAELGPGGDGRPYAFFGHSMGAVIAYELARELARRELPAPERLFLSGRFAPTPLGSASDRLDTDAKVIAMIRKLGGTVGKVFDDPDLLEMVMPPLRADYKAIGSYAWQPGRPLDIPFTVLVGDRDPVVPVEDAAAWRVHTTARSDLRIMPGGHFYLDQSVPQVAGVVRAALRRAGVDVLGAA